MSRWPMVALSEIFEPHDHWVQINPETSYRQVTVRLWGKGLCLRGHVPGSAIAATTQNEVRQGQFLISKIDARHGAFGLVPPDLHGAVVSADFPAFDMKPDRALPGFINWAAKTDWFIALCKSASEGSTNRVRLKEGRFLKQEIPLPPLDDQRQIVAQLDAVSARIDARQVATAAVEAELSAALRAAFQRVTQGARRMPMGEVAPLVRRPVEIDPDKEYTELGVRSFYKGTFHRRKMMGDEFTWQKLFWINRKDLIFSNLMAWEQGIATAQNVDHLCVGNHRILTCEVDATKSSSNFLYYYFTTPEGFSDIKTASPGSIARNKTLSSVDLKKIRVPVPSLHAQLWFDSIQAKAATALAAQAAATSGLDSLLPAMLHQIFG